MADGILDRNAIGLAAVGEKNLHGIADGALGGVEIVAGEIAVFHDLHFGRPPPHCWEIRPQTEPHWEPNEKPRRRFRCLWKETLCRFPYRGRYRHRGVLRHSNCSDPHFDLPDEQMVLTTSRRQEHQGQGARQNPSCLETHPGRPSPQEQPCAMPPWARDGLPCLRKVLETMTAGFALETGSWAAGKQAD